MSLIAITEEILVLTDTTEETMEDIEEIMEDIKLLNKFLLLKLYYYFVKWFKYPNIQILNLKLKIKYVKLNVLLKKY